MRQEGVSTAGEHPLPARHSAALQRMYGMHAGPSHLQTCIVQGCPCCFIRRVLSSRMIRAVACCQSLPPQPTASLLRYPTLTHSTPSGAMEALPLFLDRLANPVTAIIVSVTAVLFFGEIIPQSVCSRYGLSIGARLSWLVRLLMFLCSPIAWPLGKFLDWLLGAEHHSMFRRKQLKALVDIHGEDKGLGGKLSKDETKIITGALDLTSKRAFIAMTPLEHVFMLSTADKLDEPTLRSILNSGHSRIPVYRNGLRHDIVGIILVKEVCSA